jgi:curved DNA-binding protein CbpA
MDSASRDISTHYEVLGLSQTTHADLDLSPQHIKAAYRRALLQHHPDKLQSPAYSKYPQAGHEISKEKPRYTIDQISEAYAVLSVPKLRSEYNRDLKNRDRSEKNLRQGEYQGFRSGFETIDLDDLTYEESEKVWYKSCRCGDRQGFLIREPDLEEASDVTELYVGCRGCSLWLRVLFGVLEDYHIDQMTEYA